MDCNKAITVKHKCDLITLEGDETDRWILRKTKSMMPPVNSERPCLSSLSFSNRLEDIVIDHVYLSFLFVSSP